MSRASSDSSAFVVVSNSLILSRTTSASSAYVADSNEYLDNDNVSMLNMEQEEAG